MQPQRAARRRVLGRVFQQVAQHALDQHAVAFHERQMRQAVHGDAVRGQWFAHGGKRGADQLFDGLPFQAQRRVAVLQPRHVQQVGDQRVHALGLVAHGADGLVDVGRQRRLLAHKGVRHADQAGQRGAQVMRHGRQQRIAQPLGFHADQRLLRDFHIVQAFQRNGNERGIGLDLAARVRIQEQTATRGRQRQHAARAHGRLQRQVQQFAIGQGGGASACGLPVVIDPLGQGGFQRRHVLRGGRRQLQPVVHAQDVQGATRAEGGMHEGAGKGDDLLRQQRRRQFAREFVEAARIGFAFDRSLRLQAQAGRQLADEQAHRQQHAESQQILHVRNGEGCQRLHEEEIEQADADYRGQRRRSTAVAQRHRHYCQEEQHDDVGLVQGREGKHGQRGGRRAVAQRPGVARQRPRVAFIGGLACLPAQRERIASGRGGGWQRGRSQADDVDLWAARSQHVGKAVAAP